MDEQPADSHDPAGSAEPVEATQNPVKPRKGAAAAKKAAKPAAYRVMDGGTLQDRPKRPGHLYFFQPPAYTEPVPKEQEDARQLIEQVNLVLRVVFQKWHKEKFAEYYDHLLTIAWGVFSPQGFRPNSLNDLPNFKHEIALTAGGEIRSRYLWRMARFCLLATVLIGGVTFGVDWAIRTGVDKGKIVETTTNLGVDARGEGGTQKQQLMVPGKVRWNSNFSVFHTGVLVAVSMWGIFIATYLRNFSFSFESLVSGEADLMPPGIRLFAYALANTAMAVIMQVPLFTISIGNSFSTSDIDKNLPTAMLVGLFLGASEIAVVLEIKRVSQQFLARVRETPGGKVK